MKLIFLISALSCVAWLNLAPTAGAQGLKNMIPRNQGPLSRTFPPPATAQSPLGTGKFVIFTREEVGKKGEWDFIAAAWECIPSQPDLPVTKRVEFCHSTWHAEPLLDVLVRDDSADKFPRFVKLRVNAGATDRRVNLYDINYRTWDVRCIWQGEALLPFGVMQGTIFWRSGEEWFRLESSTGAIRQGTPFIPVDVNGAFWLVRKVEDQSGEWSYDPQKSEFVTRFDVVETSAFEIDESILSLDGKSRALLLVPLPKGWRGGVVSGTLLLQRDGHDNDIRIPIKMQAVAGSGQPIIPVGTNLKFTPTGSVEFSATTDKSPTNEWVWTIKIASGKIEENMRPHHSPAAPDFAMFDGVPTPAYLRSRLQKFPHFGRGGLAPAFLIYLGILKKPPEYPDCVTGVSRDGRHILYRARSGPLADDFIYGDLQTKKNSALAKSGGDQAHQQHGNRMGGNTMTCFCSTRRSSAH